MTSTWKKLSLAGCTVALLFWMADGATAGTALTAGVLPAPATSGFPDGGVIGTGTANTVPLWTAVHTLGNSQMTQAVGTVTDTGNFSIVAGTQATTVNALRVTGTLATSAVTERGARFDFSTAGAVSGNEKAMIVSLLAGATTSQSTVGAEFDNTVAGTGSSPIGTPGSPSDMANFGNIAEATATTTGTNVGVLSEGFNGNVNFGSIALAWRDKASATNVGVLSLARNTAAAPVEVGGYFGLDGALPTFTSAALVADNSDQSVPVFIARVNGATEVIVDSVGNVGIHTPSPSESLEVAGNVFINKAQDGSTRFIANNTSNTAHALAGFSINSVNGGGAFSMQLDAVASNNNTTFGAGASGNAVLTTGGAGVGTAKVQVGTQGNADVEIFTGGSPGSAATRLVVDGTTGAVTVKNLGLGIVHSSNVGLLTSSTVLTSEGGAKAFTCTLDGAATATCPPVTVPSGVVCTCSDTQPAVLGVAAVACSVSGTTATVTSSVPSDTSIVALVCAST